MLRYFYISSLICFYINVTAQQEYGREFNFVHYTIDQGLSQASINDIVLDNSGFLWIATQDGLNRFDGTSFLTFYHDNTKEGLCGSFINTLLLDSGMLWIGTRSSGLCCYDIGKDNFLNIPELAGNDIINLQKDIFGNIYATLDGNHIAVVRKTGRDKNYTISKVPLPPKQAVTTTALFVSGGKTVWVGTKEGHLFYARAKEDPADIIFKEYNLNGVKTGDINVINGNTPDKVWIGSRQALFMLDTGNGKVSHVPLSSGEKMSNIIIYDIKWKNRDMWIATGEGLYVIKNYNSSGKTILHLKHKELNRNSLSNNTVTKILFDTEGQGWVGTGKFLNLIYRDPIVNNMKSEAGNTNSLNSNVIFSINKFGSDLWAGTSGGGLNLLRSSNFTAFTKENRNLPSNVVFSVTKDSEGNIWTGTKEGVTVIVNADYPPRKMVFHNIFHVPGDSTSLSNNFVRQVYSDRNGNIWICTYNGGLNRFTGDLGKGVFRFVSYRHNTTRPGSLPADRIYCIRQAGEDEYWVGTIKGVSVMTLKNGKADFRRVEVNGSPVLTNSVIYDILVAKDKNIWIGTRNGLFFYNRKSNKLDHYNETSGMPNNVVYGILEDNKGRIWASTNNGITCFDPGTKQFINYNVEDGLADKEFNLQARFMDSDGTLYFGGINGISFFHPDRMKELDKKNMLYFNDIEAANYKTNKQEKFNIGEDNEVRLRSNQFPFYVNFSNINLTYHKNTNFAYRLIPVDRKWNLIGKKRQIPFLNLAAGDYVLEIQGVSRNKVWTDTAPLKLSMTIVPPFWKSNVAYALYLLLFLLISFYIHKFYLNKKLEHQERLRLMEVDELKTNFYTNITHELRTPLTVILGITDDIKESFDKKEKAKYGARLSVLRRNSKKLLQLINQVLDLSKIENNKLVVKATCGNIVHFMKVLTESFHSLAAHKNIDFVFYNEMEELCMDFDREKFSIVISNLLNNAIKFTPEYGKIILHVKTEKAISGKEYLVVKIKDSGIGISPGDQAKIFDRFFQAQSSGSKNIEGTGIGLAIVKEYVELMHGKISVESSEGKGTVFTITIPVSKKAVKDKKALKQKDELASPGKKKKDSIVDINKPLLLIVEDNLDVANYIASCIDPGYQIIFAQDGEEGIKMALKHVPDIVITDLMMPGKDGFELCEILKNDTATSHIPIIMLTARSLEKDKLKGYSAGADAYLIKPFNKKELRVRIEQLTELRKKLQKKYSYRGKPVTKTETAEDKFLNKLYSFIDKNLDDAGYKSSNLSTDMNLSESQLYRKIKALTNRSTAIVIRDYRLEKAKEMILNSDMNISEIAYSCGFNEPAWFTHAFKEKYNKAPSDLRK